MKQKSRNYSTLVCALLVGSLLLGGAWVRVAAAQDDELPAAERAADDEGSQPVPAGDPPSGDLPRRDESAGEVAEKPEAATPPPAAEQSPPAAVLDAPPPVAEKKHTADHKSEHKNRDGSPQLFGLTPNEAPTKREKKPTAQKQASKKTERKKTVAEKSDEPGAHVAATAPESSSTPKPAKKKKKKKKTSEAHVSIGAATTGSTGSHAPRGKTNAHIGTTQPLPPFELGRYQYCGDDRDCMIANNGCCDCANGGQDVAVSRDRYQDFRARFDCMHVKCGLKDADPICGSGVLSCVNHKCIYFDDVAPSQ